LSCLVSCWACSSSLAQVVNNDLPYEDNPDDVLIDENEYEDVGENPEESLQEVRALDDEQNEYEYVEDPEESLQDVGALDDEKNEYEDVEDPEESLQDVRALDSEQNEFEERGMRPEYEGRLNKFLPYFEKYINSLRKDRIDRDGRAQKEIAKVVSTLSPRSRKPGFGKWSAEQWKLKQGGPRKWGKWIKTSRRPGRKGATTVGPVKPDNKV